jgi:hypothetical protein
MKRKIAGHEWYDDRIDSSCILLKGEDSCRMTRATLFQATQDDVSKEGYAHTSYMSQSEYDDVCRERTEYEAHCEKLMIALRKICG